MVKGNKVQLPAFSAAHAVTDDIRAWNLEIIEQPRDIARENSVW